jgi:enoyl-CoA hydratase
LPEAVELVHELAALPQAAMRGDRLSSYERWPLDLVDALAGEYRHGIAALDTGQIQTRLDKYASGTWRRGSYA